MNCVNCGAAPRDINQTSCIYCESVLDERVPEADIDGFRMMLGVLHITASDSYKVDIVERFRKKFTAGQVRQLLATFSSDSYRVDAAEHLVPRTTNPTGLLACADLFESDSYRADFIELLDDGEEDAIETLASPAPRPTGAAPRPTGAAQRPTGAAQRLPGCVMMVLVASLCVLFLANFVWMISHP